MKGSMQTSDAMFELPGDRALLERVQITNYKSIGACDVHLKPLTIVVGRNGAGKSNFLDALRFVADGLQTSLDHALKSRGGIEVVRRRSQGHPRNFSIDLTWTLTGLRSLRYGFEIAARRGGGFIVKHEELRLKRKAGAEQLAWYEVNEGEVTGAPNHLPPSQLDRLYLVAASGLPAFREAYDVLSAMGFYNLNPEAIKELQSPDAGEILHHDGGNLVSVVARLSVDRPEVMKRIKEYLQKIVPDVADLTRVSLGPRETLEFSQKVKGAEHHWKFLAASMSDGTLRAVGALAAVMQLADRKRPVSLVGIEEPESALHPSATAALMDALAEAAMSTQVVVTTHSPELLDQADGVDCTLLAARLVEGETRIGRIDSASEQAIRDHLCTAGELLRMDQLQPEDAEHEETDVQLPLDLK